MDLSSVSVWIQLAGLGQLLLAAGSLALPYLLQWKLTLSTAPTLIRQMFWTYSAYIWSINVAMGLISVFITGELLSGTSLSVSLIAFMLIYWLSRLAIQFLYFDRSGFPTGLFYRIGEAMLVVLFAVLVLIYGIALLKVLR